MQIDFEFESRAWLVPCKYSSIHNVLDDRDQRLMTRIRLHQLPTTVMFSTIRAYEHVALRLPSDTVKVEQLIPNK